MEWVGDCFKADAQCNELVELGPCHWLAEAGAITGQISPSPIPRERVMR